MTPAFTIIAGFNGGPPVWRFEVRLALPPMGQERSRSTASGHHYTPERTREWERAASAAFWAAWRGPARLARPDGGEEAVRYPSAVERQGYAGAVRATIEAEFPVPKKAKAEDVGAWFVGRPDADNVAKATLDALVKSGVIVDDALVAELVVRKRLATRASVLLVLEPLSGATWPHRSKA